LLPAAKFAVNNSKNESTGETPAFLVQGQHPLTPVTIQTDSAVPAARLFASQLQQTILNVQHSLHKAQDRQKAYADRHRREVKYNVDEQVLLSTRNLAFKAVGTRKFLPKFIGPFPITQVVGNAAVHLQLPHTYRIHPVFHVSLLKPYRQSEYTATPPPPLEADEEGIPFYEVEDIINHKPIKMAGTILGSFLSNGKAMAMSTTHGSQLKVLQLLSSLSSRIGMQLVVNLSIHKLRLRRNLRNVVANLKIQAMQLRLLYVPRQGVKCEAIQALFLSQAIYNY
jgi:hypothetical protein